MAMWMDSKTQVWFTKATKFRDRNVVLFGDESVCTSIPYSAIPSVCQTSGLDILLQTPQPIFCIIEHAVILTDGKSQPVFGQVCVRIGEEFGGWNSSHSQLCENKPAEFEVARSGRYMRREVVVFG